MPNVNPGSATIAPGVVTNQNAYPQWGVGGGTPGSSAGWKVVEASNAAQKATYEQQGYLVWFSSSTAAQSFVSSESSAYGSGSPSALTGLAAIGDFFQRLGQANTWLRVGEVVLGLILIAVGVARITRAVPVATSVAKTVGMVAAV